MSATITLEGDWLTSLGNRRQVQGTGNLGAYVNTGGNHGVAVTPAMFGLGVIEALIISNAGGYSFEYVASTGRIKAYVSGSSVPDIKITGGQAAGPALQITPDSAAGVLGKTAATDRTIPGATFGFVAAGSTTALEVDNAVSLSAFTFTFNAIGR